MVTEALAAAGVPHRINHWGNLFSVFFTDAEVTDYDSAKTQDSAAFARFFHAMLMPAFGWRPAPSRSPVSDATQAELDVIAAALPTAARAAAAK